MGHYFNSVTVIKIEMQDVKLEQTGVNGVYKCKPFHIFSALLYLLVLSRRLREVL